MDEDLKPTKVEKIVCPKCGELMAKIYPNSSYRIEVGAMIHNCRKCIQKYRNSIKHKKFIPDLERMGMREA